MGEEVTGAGGCPVGYRLTLPFQKPQGRLAFFVACQPCLQLTFFPPSPRPPSRREGGDFLFSYARGFAPCIPGAEPEATLGQGGRTARPAGGRAFLVAG